MGGDKDEEPPEQGLASCGGLELGPAGCKHCFPSETRSAAGMVQGMASYGGPDVGSFEALAESQAFPS